MTIQFICRGNAFRSIIAEAYTNSLKIEGLIVFSSGTVASNYKERNSLVFQKTLALLKKHGISQYAKSHYADNISQDSLDKTDLAICLNRIVFDEAISSFSLPQEIITWDVTDIGENGRIANTEADLDSYAEDVYCEITKNVDDLLSSKLLRISKK